MTYGRTQFSPSKSHASDGTLLDLVNTHNVTLLSRANDAARIATSASVLGDGGPERMVPIKQTLAFRSVVEEQNLSPFNCRVIHDLSDTIAKDFYAKKLPSYEEITVLWDGKEVPWMSLSLDQQYAMLLDGARGNDIGEVEEIGRLVKEAKESPEKAEKAGKEIREMVLFDDENPSFRCYHGVKHSIRAALTVEAVARVYGELFEEFESIPEKQIQRAIMAAIFHDSGRQAEGVDIFSNLSAANAERELRRLEFAADTVTACAEAIRRKDEKVAEKSSIAILLHEADCLEYQRLGPGFNSKYLDACGKTSDGKSMLTLKEGITEGRKNEFLDKLVATTCAFIGATGSKDLDHASENPIPTYADMRKVAEGLHLFDLARTLPNLDNHEEGGDATVPLGQNESATFGTTLGSVDQMLEIDGASEKFTASTVKRAIEIGDIPGLETCAPAAQKFVLSYANNMIEDGIRDGFAAEIGRIMAKLYGEGVDRMIPETFAFGTGDPCDENSSGIEQSSTFIEERRDEGLIRAWEKVKILMDADGGSSALVDEGVPQATCGSFGNYTEKMQSFYLKQFTNFDPKDHYWRMDLRKAKELYAKDVVDAGREEVFGKSVAWYQAFTGIILSRVNFEGHPHLISHENNTCKVQRGITRLALTELYPGYEDVREGQNYSGLKNPLLSSTSLGKPTWEFTGPAFDILEFDVPFHRIPIMFLAHASFTAFAPFTEFAPFANEREFLAMLHGLPAKLVRKATDPEQAKLEMLETFEDFAGDIIDYQKEIKRSPEFVGQGSRLTELENGFVKLCNELVELGLFKDGASFYGDESSADESSVDESSDDESSDDESSDGKFLNSSQKKKVLSLPYKELNSIYDRMSDLLEEFENLSSLLKPGQVHARKAWEKIFLP
jgi:hypothetical protein